MRRNLSICIIALLSIISCSRFEVEQSHKYTFSIDGTLEEMAVGDETKASLAHTMRMTWAKGDAVSVVNLTKGKALGGTLTADQKATVSTFSGTVTGDIDNGDVLALIYPNLGFSQEQPFTTASVDFSTQDGTANNAKFCAVAKITADVSDGNFVAAETHFFMKSSMLNATLADLSYSSAITSISFPGLYSGINLSINSTNDDIVLSGTTGAITLSPTGKTSTTGTIGLYIGFGGAPSVSARRTISVNCGDEIYESTMTNSALNAGAFYSLSVGAFEKKSSTNGFTFNYDDSEMGDGGTVVIDGSSE